MISKYLSKIALRADFSSVGSYLRNVLNGKRYFAPAVISMVALMSTSVATANTPEQNGVVVGKQAKSKDNNSVSSKGFAANSTSSASPKLYPIRSKGSVDALYVLARHSRSLSVELVGGGAPPFFYSHRHIPEPAPFLGYGGGAINFQQIFAWAGKWFWGVRAEYELSYGNSKLIKAIYPLAYLGEDKLYLNKIGTKMVVGVPFGSNIVSIAMGVNGIPLLGVPASMTTWGGALYGLALDVGYERLITDYLSISSRLGYEVYLDFGTQVQSLNLRVGVSYKFG